MIGYGINNLCLIGLISMGKDTTDMRIKNGPSPESPSIIRCTRCRGTFYGGDGEGDRQYEAHRPWCPWPGPTHPYWKKALILFTTILSLVSCGGGGPDPAPGSHILVLDNIINGTVRGHNVLCCTTTVCCVAVVVGRSAPYCCPRNGNIEIFPRVSAPQKVIPNR